MTRPTTQPTQHLGTPLRPRQGRWLEGTGNLEAAWFCYDPRGRGVAYARPYHDRLGRIRWRITLGTAPEPEPTADEAQAASEVRQRLGRVDVPAEVVA